jgi:hypothetical protein
MFNTGDKVRVVGYFDDSHRVSTSVGYVAGEEDATVCVVFPGWVGGHGAGLRYGFQGATRHNCWWIPGGALVLISSTQDAGDSTVKHYNLIKKIREMETNRKELGYAF